MGSRISLKTRNWALELSNREINDLSLETVQLQGHHADYWAVE